MNVPSMFKLEGDSIIFNIDDSEFLFYIPENFFEDSKSATAVQDGEYVTTIGLFCWAIVDKTGKRGPLHLFNFPSMFMCKPYMIETVRGLVLDENFYGDKDDYKVLHFKKGDQVVSQIRVPQLVDNAELFFALACFKAKIPTAVPYEEGWKLFERSAKLNGFSYGIHSQLFGILWSTICRDPNNIAQPFRLSKDIDNPHGYKPLSLKMVAKFVSPYTAITSEGFDEGIQSAILMKDKDTPKSPLEKVLMQ